MGYLEMKEMVSYIDEAGMKGKRLIKRIISEYGDIELKSDEEIDRFIDMGYGNNIVVIEVNCDGWIERDEIVGVSTSKEESSQVYIKLRNTEAWINISDNTEIVRYALQFIRNYFFYKNELTTNKL